MTPATAETETPTTTVTGRPLKERARFVADLHGQNAKPIKVTIERQREAIDTETGRKYAVPDTGKYLHFTDEGNGIQSYETDDPDLIQLLRVRSNEFGVFHEVPVMKPASADTLRQIQRLILAADVDGLVALAAEEEDTHQRDDVLEAIAEALEVLR